ncbi:hypothetical protein WMF38_25580 [Sorangium sp. So ce118]
MDGELGSRSLWHLVKDLAELLRRYPTGVPEPLLQAAATSPGRAFPFALIEDAP